MILIEKTQIMGLEPTIRGMRNPMNSWEKSDTVFATIKSSGETHCKIGPNDHDLMLRLARAGSVDGKFRRMIAVYVDLTAPLYWWKEFDTYKVGTVANSCSTMHKIHAKEFTLDDFSHEHLFKLGANADFDQLPKYNGEFWDADLLLQMTVKSLNHYRQMFLDTGDKRYWWQMIQLLPSSYNQKRTVMLNYEVLSNIYQHRRNHKLDEWREVCRWIESLPYSEIITCNVPSKAEQEQIKALKTAMEKLRFEQWSTEEITKAIRAWGEAQKEQLKSFADHADTRPVHGGIFDKPDLTAKES